ncbi:MAG: hypothetical protein ABR540_10550 [Acidimicrobiales bacterium]
MFPTGNNVHMPPPSRADLEGEGVEVVEERGPSLLLDGTVPVSGQTERVTGFEKGVPNQRAHRAERAHKARDLQLDGLYCHDGFSLPDRLPTEAETGVALRKRR